MGPVGVLYTLDLSHRGIETVVGLFGHTINHVNSCRNMQRPGEGVRKRLPRGRARIVGVYETLVKGRSRPVGVVVDVGGRTLGKELTGKGFDYEGWFHGMVDELGVDVMATDDSTNYSPGIADGSARPHQYLVHMERTVRGV